MATKKEKEWLNRISSFGCVICKKYFEIQDPPPACCHHIREGMGKGQRNNDYMVLPLCIEHHQGNTGFHAGKKTFISKWGTESELLEWVLEKMEE